MEAPCRPPVTDSPWFWVLMFSVMALVALAAMSGKYGRRQTVIERQYQARDRVADLEAGKNNLADAARTDRQATRREFASPSATLIPLWPLAAVLVVVAVFAAVMLIRSRGRPDSLAAESLSQ